MTADQEARLIAAFKNIELLLEEQDFAELVTTTVAIFTGQAAELEKEDSMPRGKKKATTPAAAPSQPTQVTSVVVPADITQLITEWKQAADASAQWKEKEHALRQALVAQMFDPNKLEGTETKEIGYGYQLRVTKEMAYNATDKEDQATKLQDLLFARTSQANLEPFDLFRWKPEVAIKVYRQVLEIAQKYNDNEVLAALHAAITLKPGMPQLEMIPPKQDEPVAVQQPVVTEPQANTAAAPVWQGTFEIEENFSTR